MLFLTFRSMLQSLITPAATALVIYWSRANASPPPCTPLHSPPPLWRLWRSSCWLGLNEKGSFVRLRFPRPAAFAWQSRGSPNGVPRSEGPGGGDIWSLRHLLANSEEQMSDFRKHAEGSKPASCECCGPISHRACRVWFSCMTSSCTSWHLHVLDLRRSSGSWESNRKPHA